MCHHRTLCSAVIRRSWRWPTRLSSNCGRAGARVGTGRRVFRAFRPDQAMTGGLEMSKVNLAPCRAALHRKRPEATRGEVHGDGEGVALLEIGVGMHPA